MPAFDFLEGLPKYGDDAKEVARQRQRHAFLIEPFLGDIKGARVLDIAAHDGRWSYAFADAGAASVLGIEGREELVDLFSEFPHTPAKDRVSLRVEDLYDGLDRLLAEKQTFDVIALFGIMYHVMDHFRIVRQCVKLSAKLIIIDSEFVKGVNPYIQIIKERTDYEINATPQIEGQALAIKGVLSNAAMERIAEALNCDMEWLPWEDLPKENRTVVRDYFRGPQKKMVRRTCALRPNRDRSA
ncbi:class I SAM-dependent methyltransferase [Sulfitobacter sp. JB4-11]|uniref:class I SAM-dependent methyltransferase n=1 Tax=Sulfitobacter rhodophyticola TaxID=3238304 RepID=UPI003516D92B